MRYAIKSEIGAQIVEGEMDMLTLAEIGGVYPVLESFWSLPEVAMDIIDGQLVKRTDEDIHWRTLPAKYKVNDGGTWREMTTEEKRIIDLPDEDKTIDPTSVIGWRELTVEEKAERDAEKERVRQAAKSLALKTVENNFLLFCEILTGSKDKLGFAQLEAILNAMLVTDPNNAIVLSVRLLAIDAEGKREGGNIWWDDVCWHPELV